MEMILTEEMQRAVSLVESDNQPLYITGKAGTGKTTLLKYMVENMKKRFVITASTGIAAINAGGTTLHSLMGIPIGIINPKGKMKGFFSKGKIALVKAIEVLIIDEVSMIRPDMIDYVDRKLRFYRSSDEPFGGVKVVMFGDLYQLPPVVPKNELTALRLFYPGVYFFYANVFKRCGFNIVELTHIFRQSEDKFIRILNNIRAYNLSEDDLDDLAEIRDKSVSQDFTNENVHICSHKKEVKKINDELLGAPSHVFLAVIEGDFNANSVPCDMELALRKGARVMTLINDHDQGFSNGSLGEVIDIMPDSITVHLDSGVIATIRKHTWTSYKYDVKDNEIIQTKQGSCQQFPLILAWAITIHKSQGLTFDNVVVHAKRCFTPGQIYVALSRCRTLEGITTDSFISRRHIHKDDELLAFEEAYHSDNNFFNHKTLEKLLS